MVRAEFSVSLLRIYALLNTAVLRGSSEPLGDNRYERKFEQEQLQGTIAGHQCLNIVTDGFYVIFGPDDGRVIIDPLSRRGPYGH